MRVSRIAFEGRLERATVCRRHRGFFRVALTAAERPYNFKHGGSVAGQTVTGLPEVSEAVIAVVSV